MKKLIREDIKNFDDASVDRFIEEIVNAKKNALAGKWLY